LTPHNQLVTGCWADFNLSIVQLDIQQLARCDRKRFGNIQRSWSLGSAAGCRREEDDQDKQTPVKRHQEGYSNRECSRGEIAVSFILID
jgi:hypothetical protein